MESQPVFFPTPDDFREWLTQHHDKATELLVGFYKTGSGKPSITWSESVDQALCFGWIDGVRRSIDRESYSIRFTPRRARSTWSAVNIKKVSELSAKGLMKPPGIAAFNLRSVERSGIYTYENEEAVLPEKSGEIFKANQVAWSWFQAMPKSYRKTAIKWIMSAKQETTRVRRLGQLIADCEAGRKLKQLSY
jgi:uncharacterized protein YdeI (YjbR/CyaY-like superfamily)